MIRTALPTQAGIVRDIPKGLKRVGSEDSSLRRLQITCLRPRG
jgi:hypothetical protein